MISEDDAPKAHTDLEVEEPLTEPPVRKPSPWKAFILTGLLAGLIGAGGGAYGVYAGLKAQAPDVVPDVALDVTALTAPLTAKIEGLEKRLTAAESAAKAAGGRPILKTKPVDLSTIKSRLNALETASPLEIDPSAITALQAAQADGFEWPDVSTLETRVAEMETVVSSLPEDMTSDRLPMLLSEMADRLEALEADVLAVKNADPVAAVDPQNMKALKARLSALENRAVAAPRIERIAVLAFPKKALLDAVDANAKGSFVKKALSRHVRVKDDDNPLTLIEAIEVDISKGRLEAAANKFERLPPPVKTAGQAWYESVKASL